jgi:hypothetical protein
MGVRNGHNAKKMLMLKAGNKLFIKLKLPYNDNILILIIEPV